ncbi:MAG: molybdenum cofactor guanylyltransferase, partial [Candidatus Dormibacteraeota bacterium]|nr:molybdenum cofactor guanylyltransferase [Candidatus Dormibacteraeota bacterium]
ATLLLLAGGASRRMGTPKALLPVGESTLLEWLHSRLAGGFDEVLVSANNRDLVPAGLAMIPDRRPGSGPLAGIEAGLMAARNDALVVVACDMPRVTPSLLAGLVSASAGHDAAVPRVGGRAEPACACYRRSALGAVSRALDEGRRGAAEVLTELRVRWLDELDPELFWNLNTPADYQVFRSAL